MSTLCVSSLLLSMIRVNLSFADGLFFVSSGDSLISERPNRRETSCKACPSLVDLCVVSFFLTHPLLPPYDDLKLILTLSYCLLVCAD